jgi:histidine triad (HIT) family protein
MKELLFKIARSDVSRFFIGVAFEKLSRLMPLDRIVESPQTIVFKHPVPQWETHLLAVSKKAIRDFDSINLDDPIHVKYILDIFRSIQVASTQSELETYAVLVNGGEYQDVPQLHFHVISGKNKDGADPIYPLYRSSVTKNPIYDETEAITIEGSPLFRDFHKVIYSRDIKGSVHNIDLDNAKIFSTITIMLKAIQKIIQKSALDKYKILIVHQPSETPSDFTIHVISGDSK